MSREFEQLSKSLIVEIVRRKEIQSSCKQSVNSGEMKTLYETNLDHTNCIPYNITNGTSLEQDIAIFLATNEFCDVTLVLQDHEIPAHKAILAARSKYFEILFQSYITEDNRVNVKIGFVLPTLESFDSLLKYIYYGETNMPPENSLYLYSSSIYYAFTNNRLQAFCKHNLEWNVNENNVLKILIASDRLKNTEMKEHALDLIVKQINRIVIQDDMKTLHKELLMQIIQCLAAKAK